MVEVEELSGFWLAAGRLCWLISVAVPVAVAAFVVVVLIVAAVKGVVVVARAIGRRVLHRDRIEAHIDSRDRGISPWGGGHLRPPRAV